MSRIILVLVTLLSITAGIAKVMKVDQELAFFQSAGFSEALLILFGAIQIAAGVFLVILKTRIAGAILAALMFAISTAVIFLAGKTGFGIFSILPILMAAFVIRETIKHRGPP